MFLYRWAHYGVHIANNVAYGIMDFLNKAQRRRNMQAIKSSGTKIETILRKALSKEGLRYRLNAKNIIGKPDIAFIGAKVAVFCDSEFWHGKHWKKERLRIKTNGKFWRNKIEANIRRDKKVTRLLRKAGWDVIRLWGKDILKHPDKCVMRVKDALRISSKNVK